MTKSEIVIVFYALDLELAHFIVKRLGFGTITAIKYKKAYFLRLTGTSNIEAIIHLINPCPVPGRGKGGKVRTVNKYNKMIKLLSSTRFTDLRERVELKRNITDYFNNYWLAGFTDADGSFQIKILNRAGRSKQEIRLSFQLDQKTDEVLKLILNHFGGNLGYRAKQDTYYYASTSFGSAESIVNYFDRYLPPMGTGLHSSKYLNYLKWREAYVMVTNKEHLSDIGIKKIVNLKSSMNSFST